MSRIRSKGNRDTELVLIRLFKAAKLTGWRRNLRLFGRPDFVFRKERVAVFVDGCFWHSCPVHGTKPKSNTKYWEAKLMRNRARDLEVTAALQDQGWTVFRFWEHDLKNPKRTILKLKHVVKPT